MNILNIKFQGWARKVFRGKHNNAFQRKRMQVEIQEVRYTFRKKGINSKKVK